MASPFPLIPANAGTQDRLELKPQAEAPMGKLRQMPKPCADLSWVPAFAGMSGVGE